MIVKKNDSKRTVREIYRASNERVSQALKLFGSPRADTAFEMHSDKDHDAISNLLAMVVSAQKAEDETEYRVAILDVGTWVESAYRKEYLTSQSRASSNIFYIIKKGLEVLHTLLHRDLRRRQLSPTESQMYYAFQKLRGAVTDPRTQTYAAKRVS